MKDIITTAVRFFLFDSKQAALIWIVLAAGAVIAFILLVATSRREWHGISRSGPAWTAEKVKNLTEEIKELDQYAEEKAIAAHEATTATQRLHREWIAAKHKTDEAWKAFEKADAAAQRIVQAQAIAVPRIHLTPYEVALREQHLHRVAEKAFHRDELSAEHLLDALSDRNGWNPCRHPADQEVILLILARHQRLRAYLAASADERSTWHDADVATSVRITLNNEAYGAALRAHHVRTRLAALTQRRHSRSGAGGDYLPVFCWYQPCDTSSSASM